jgi:RNA polymerase sigma-70 factor (ECF subfamily)
LQHQSDEEKLVAADLVNRVLETMSTDDRLVLTLIDGEGHSIRDIMDMTGWTESKVKIQAFRARRRMREAVENLMRKKQKQKA